MSDWGAVNERVAGLEAGLELEMPSNNGVGDQKIIAAVRNGRLAENILDEAVERILKVIFKAADSRQAHAIYDPEIHHSLARQAARETMVLLKNEDHILPLNSGKTIAVLGAFVKNPRYQGEGSSHVNPLQLDDILIEIKGGRP
jgi:beta-glucosidase